MAQPKRRIVAELGKLYENLLTKGKDQHQAHRNVTETMIRNRETLPKLPTTQQLVDRMKGQVSSSMTAYEDFIGIRQVKEAHERVLAAELNFKSCQEERRTAQTELAEVQNQLRVLRVDIDRTPRGDNRYLELIKNEIDIIRNERELRTNFEELERREREVFSELSNALRFSHEKERAQTEKTKYWSILGSLIGACIGIIGTTINSRLRHKQTKAILAQTSEQVQQIEETVMQLVNKLDADKIITTAAATSVTPTLINSSAEIRVESIAQLLKAFEDQENRMSEKTTELIAVASAVERKVGKLLVQLAYHEDPGLDPGLVTPNLHLINPSEKGPEGYEKEILWSALGLLVISSIMYKLF